MQHTIMRLANSLSLHLFLKVATGLEVISYRGGLLSNLLQATAQVFTLFADGVVRNGKKCDYRKFLFCYKTKAYSMLR
jgi:hypothetical protein